MYRYPVAGSAVLRLVTHVGFTHDVDMTTLPATSRRRAFSRRTIATSLALLVCALLLTDAALADSTPVDRLPPGPAVRVEATRNTLVAIALPRPKRTGGLVWRLARPVDRAVAREVSEGEVGDTIVVVFRAVGRGSVTVRYALTRGDASSVAVASRTTHLTVT